MIEGWDATTLVLLLLLLRGKGGCWRPAAGLGVGRRWGCKPTLWCVILFLLCMQRLRDPLISGLLTKWVLSGHGSGPVVLLTFTCLVVLGYIQSFRALVPGSSGRPGWRWDK